MSKPSLHNTHISPGFKSLLVSDSVFHKLQEIQKSLPLPSRLTVGDLATGALEEVLSQNKTDKIVHRAREFVGKSFL